MNDKVKEEGLADLTVSWGLIGLGVLAALGGVLRIACADESFLKRVDQTTLMYLAAGGALMLLRNVKSLSFGDNKVEFQEMKKATEEAKRAARIAEDAVIYGVTPNGKPRADLQTGQFQPGTVANDPWKGVFEGSPERNGRRLSAKVVEMTGRAGWFSIDLVLEANSPGQKPLSGQVQFFIHDSFANPTPLVQVGPDGRAQLHLTSWGAFTVGAVADGGATKLELDLAELADAPKAFRER